MYAIIELGGRQWKVEPGTRLEVNRVPGEIGSTHTVEQVLVAHDGQALQVGRPYLAGAKVVCEVLAHPRGPKTISYRFRRRENWRKTVGHRQSLTRLVVKDILCSGRAGDAEPAEALSRAPKPTVKKASAKSATKASAKRISARK